METGHPYKKSSITLNIQKKKLRLQGAGMFAMSLTTSKKKDSYAVFESEMNKKPRLQTPVSAKTF